jgi:TonB family protein
MNKLFLYLLLSSILFILQVEQLEANTNESQYQLMHSPYPTFPRKAHTQGKSGFIEVDIQFNEQGEVIDIDITDAENRKVFEESVLYAVSGWKLDPKTKVKVTIHRVFNFNFQHHSKDLTSSSKEVLSRNSNNMVPYKQWLKIHNTRKKSYKNYIKRKHGSKKI